MMREAVEGMVRVVSGVGSRKAVASFRMAEEGIHKSHSPLRMFCGVKRIVQTPAVM